jgi:hypothetical protein
MLNDYDYAYGGYTYELQLECETIAHMKKKEKKITFNFGRKDSVSLKRMAEDDYTYVGHYVRRTLFKFIDSKTMLDNTVYASDLDYQKIAFRLTMEEYEAIEKQLRKYKMNLSDYLRKVMLMHLRDARLK